MYDQRRHDELSQNVDAAWARYDDANARAERLLKSHGSDSPEYQSALLGDVIVALEEAHAAASEMEAYIRANATAKA
ncbi:hypothetical protein [Corallococcus exiguus]|uniref:hypothetical protein n=1 Tax=Corallococcus exiguus TaxID=83462 RepID=UPI001471CB6F|nr:hypothetical protein [Corallococcus exiguus]NNB89920.1 hypothetical protein [Corallococcus exiguus]